MCGIAGFCNMPENWQENIHRMNNRMLHRGPDAEGVWSNEDNTVVLGHRRLSILDLSEAGSQPMVSASGRFVIVLNGEIYNFNEIRKKLLAEKRNFRFRGSSDTEILLEAFEEYGMKDVLQMAKGMFAIALYDRKEKRLQLARDRMGEKPLYYGFIGRRFIFASDIAVIKENTFFEENINRDALTLYFRYGYIPAPYTIYKNINKLEAGTMMELRAPFESASAEKYWDITEVAYNGQNNLFRGSEKEAADELERLLKESISGQMVADVPVGAFLSGGIDSSTVVALMQSISEKRVKTFTIGFENENYNEAQDAKKIAHYLGTDHRELYVSDREIMDTIPKMSFIYGEPFADSSQIPTYLVSKLAKSEVTVSLSGDGGDELFCGYGIYRIIDELWKKTGSIPEPLKKTVKFCIGHSALDRNFKLHLIGHYLGAKTPAEMYAMTGSAVKGIENIVLGGHIPDFKYSQYNNSLQYTRNNLMLMDMLMYHPDDILTKVDRSGMAVSLESRIPLLDRDILEFAWKLPLKYKADSQMSKKVLKNVLYRHIPKELMDRPKKGFAIPIDGWLRKGELREWAEDLLSPAKIKAQGIIDEKTVGRYWDNFIKTGKWNRHLWYLLMFQQWMS